MKQIDFPMIFVCIILICGSLSGASKKESEEQFLQASELYDKEEYTEAAAEYQKILDEGYHSAELYYNLGNCYLKLNHLAEAVLNYERAIKLNPAEKQIFDMLSMARDAIGSDIIEVQDFVLLRYWKKFSQILSPLSWIVLQFVFGLTLLGGLYYWRFSDLASLKRKGFIIFIFGLMSFVTAFLAGAKSDNIINNSNDAIVMEEVILKSGPDSRSSDLHPLKRGEKVELIDEIDNWYKVILLNKEVGWLASESLKRI